MPDPVTPDRPSVEAEIAALERAARISEEDGPTVANNQLLAAAREALLSRFLEQQKELEERTFTAGEAEEIMNFVPVDTWASSATLKAILASINSKCRRIAAIQPGGTPRNE